MNPQQIVPFEPDAECESTQSNVIPEQEPLQESLQETLPTTVQPTRVPEAKTRLRIRFTKCGDLRWISHRDLARVWERLLRRAGLQLAFSQGFHPKPKISFPSALALGIEALEEVVELEVLGGIDLLSIGDVLRREMPSGMTLLELRALQTALGKAKVLGATYRIEHRCDPHSYSVEELQKRIEEIRLLPQLALQRDDKIIVLNTSDPYFDLKIEGEYFVFALPTVAQGSIRPSELLAHVGLGSLLEDGWTLQRTAVHLLDDEPPPTTT